MYFRNASMRGVIATEDIIQTPPRRVAIVTNVRSRTAITAATVSTMAPGSDDAAGQRAGDDVPARRQDMRTDHRNCGGGQPGKQVFAAFPLTDDDGGEIGHHHRIKAEAREIAEKRTGQRADRGPTNPHYPHRHAAAEQRAGV